MAEIDNAINNLRTLQQSLDELTTNNTDKIGESTQQKTLFQAIESIQVDVPADVARKSDISTSEASVKSSITTSETNIKTDIATVDGKVDEIKQMISQGGGGDTNTTETITAEIKIYDILGRDVTIPVEDDTPDSGRDFFTDKTITLSTNGEEEAKQIEISTGAEPVRGTSFELEHGTPYDLHFPTVDAEKDGYTSKSTDKSFIAMIHNRRVRVTYTKLVPNNEFWYKSSDDERIGIGYGNLRRVVFASTGIRWEQLYDSFDEVFDNSKGVWKFSSRELAEGYPAFYLSGLSNTMEYNERYITELYLPLSCVGVEDSFHIYDTSVLPSPDRDGLIYMNQCCIGWEEPEQWIEDGIIKIKDGTLFIAGQAADTYYPFGSYSDIFLPKSLRGLSNDWLHNMDVDNKNFLIPKDNGIKYIGDRALNGASVNIYFNLYDPNPEDPKSKLPNLPEPATLLFNNVFYVGDYAFASSNLLRLEFTDNLIHIGEGAFVNCNNLKLVILPSTVQFIRARAFNNDSSGDRKVLICNAIEPPYLDYMGDDEWVDSYNWDVYVPDESLERYRTRPTWNMLDGNDRLHPLSEFGNTQQNPNA